MKQTIIRKDGVSYERKIKQSNYGKNITFRVNERQLDMLNELSNMQTRNITEIIRNAIENYYKENQVNTN